MRYQSNGGGTFVKFETVGTKHEGKFLGTRQLPNKFKGGADTVVDLMRADGTRISIRLDKKDLTENWAIIDPRPSAGEHIVFTFEGTYPSKFGNPGKRIPIDMPERADDGAPTTQAPAAGSSDVETAYAALVKVKGEAAAKAIKKAAEGVAKGDLAKQTEILTKAVAA